MHKHILRVLLAVGFLLLLAVQLPAQSSGSGAISGVVTDPSGAVVPDVQITAKNLQTGDTRAVHSGPQGSYTISALPPGDYSVEAIKSGFKSMIVSPFTVHTTNTEALNVKLEVGTTGESVSVEANAERLQLESALIQALAPR